MGRQFKPGQLQTGSLYNISSSYAVTASYAANGGGGSSIDTGSFATTGSNNFIGNQRINGNVTVTGSIYIPDNTYGIYFSGSAAPSKLTWNDTDGTLDLGLKGGNVTLQIGQEEVVRVVNKTGADLLESQYRVVRVRSVSEGGAQGQRLAIVLAQANNDANSATTIGIVTENITNNQEGFITTFGLVRGINTTGTLQGETWVDGDMIYLSPTTPGAITNIKPEGPNHSVVLGYVVYAHNNQGKIFVKVDNGYEIDELHNVHIETASLVPGNLLIRSGSVWTNTNQLTGSYAVTGSLTATSFTGSLLGTASFAESATRADVAGTVDLYSFGADVESYVLVSNVIATPGVAIGGDSDLRYNTSTNKLTVGSVSATTLTGSLLGTASYATQALSASFALSAVSASYAPDTTFPYTGSARITGSLGVTGSASILAFTSSASNIFTVRNSANTFNLLNIDGVGLISGRTDGAGGFNMNYQGTANTTVQLTFNNGNPTLRVANSSGGHAFNVYTSTDDREYLAGLIGKATFAIGANPLGGTIKPNEANTNTLYVFNGTAPALSATDSFNLYSADRGGTAGKASAHFRAEDGTVNVLGDLSGIGTATPQARLDIRAQGALSTDTAMRVRNSGNTYDILAVNGDSSVQIGSDTLASGKLTIAAPSTAVLNLDTGYSTDTATISISRRISPTYNTNAFLFTHNTFSDGNVQPYRFHFVNPSTYWGYSEPAFPYILDAGYMWFKDSATAGNLQMKLSPDNALQIYSSSRSWVTTANNPPIETYISGGFQIFASGSPGTSGGNTIPYIRTENSTLLWLGGQSRLLNVTASNMMIGATSSLALFTSVNTTVNVGTTTIYAVPTASYDGIFIDYTARSGSNARAGQLMGIWSGSAVNYTETTTTDFGSTSAITFGMSISASTMIVSASATTAAWTVKTIIRSM